MIILGVAIVSILTAFIASDLVARRTAEQEDELEDEALDLADAIERLGERLDRIEAALRSQTPRRPST